MMTVEIFLDHGHTVIVRCDNFAAVRDEFGDYESYVFVEPKDIVEFNPRKMVGWRIL
jgi:hypothetical protein